MSARPVSARLLVAILVLAAVPVVLLAAWTLVQATQIRDLQRQVVALDAARRAAEAQATQQASIAGDLESRLQAVEALDTGRQIEALRAQLETDRGPEQDAELEVRLAGIQAAVDGFQGDLEDLAARIQGLDLGGALPPALPGQVRLQVPARKQGHNLSCESSAASMAARYQGVALDEEEVLATLPRHPNPHLGFRGSVDGPPGGLEDYGVYAGPILAVLREQGLDARAIEDGLAGIKGALARGNPVVAWITYNCQPGNPTTVTVDGQAVTLVAYQHAVVLTGYDDEGVWANDPWDGQEDFYANDDLERAMGYLGDMAIEVGPPGE
ncbi:MAG: C39 family peptidase [Anaerolineaceae bacterium]|nr:C39 family peptidase [Anaerolineaceae bacterium]